MEGETTEGTVELEVTEGEPHPTVSTMSFHHDSNATTLVNPPPPPPLTTTEESHSTNNIGYGCTSTCMIVTHQLYFFVKKCQVLFLYIQ